VESYKAQRAYPTAHSHIAATLARKLLKIKIDSHVANY
jgi:hypothetical protein